MQDQGVGKFGFPRGLSPWLVDGCLLTASLHGLSSVCVYVLLFSSCKDTSQIGLRAHPNDLI